MKNLFNKTRFYRQHIVALLVYISRFGMLPANISPLGSFGFFSQNLPVYFLTIIAFDFLKGGFYPGFLFTYIGFLGYWILGRFAKTTKLKLLLLPVASFVFFLVSNLGSWWFMYPHTLEGLVACYIAAIPFYRNTLLGDLVFGYGYVVLHYSLNIINFKKNCIVSFQ